VQPAVAAIAELLVCWVLCLRHYEQIFIEYLHFCTNGVSLAQNFRYKGLPATNYFSCRKIRMIDLLYVIKMWAEFSFVLSQCTHLMDIQMNGRTDGQTDFDSKTVHMQSQSYSTNSEYIEYGKYGMIRLTIDDHYLKMMQLMCCKESGVYTMIHVQCTCMPCSRTYMFAVVFTLLHMYVMHV